MTTSPSRPGTKAPPITPDGRYLVVRGRLWRTSNPNLEPERRTELVELLMLARRAVRDSLRAQDSVRLREARAQVDSAKRELGERGRVWWSDGAPDYNRHMAANTPYADWHAAMRDIEERPASAVPPPIVDKTRS